MPIAVITLQFDPTLRAGPVAVRWETIGLAATLFVALLVTAAFARAGGRPGGLSRLRLDDLLFLAMAAVPGAIVGGRAVLALAHLDYYQAHPGALLDPAQGSLSLLGAVLGATVTAAYMCRLLQVPARRWLDAAAAPLLVAIGLGKLAYLLGGGGQGAPWDGRWALAFAGPGPWLSPLPSVPAHPSQVYEAAWALLGAVVVLVLSARRVRRGFDEVGPDAPRFGALYLSALAWWLLGRVLVGFTWVDPPTVAGLRAEQVGALVVLVVLVAAAAWWTWPRRSGERGRGSSPGAGQATG